MRSSLLTLVFAIRLIAAESRLAKPAPTVDAYDFIEATLNVAQPDATNPFTVVSITGEFGQAGNAEKRTVISFCDSADGSVNLAGWIGRCFVKQS